MLRSPCSVTNSASKDPISSSCCVQEKVFSHAEELFEEGDTNHDGKLSSEELQDLLMRVSVRCSSMHASLCSFADARSWQCGLVNHAHWPNP